MFQNLKRHNNIIGLGMLLCMVLDALIDTYHILRTDAFEGKRTGLKANRITLTVDVEKKITPTTSDI